GRHVGEDGRAAAAGARVLLGAGGEQGDEQGDAALHAFILRPFRGIPLPMSTDLRARADEAMGKIVAAASSFTDKARAHAGVELPALIDPDGDAVASLVDVEGSAGAAALALPIEVITFDSWVLGHIGDRDELDLDVNTHKELWFGFGAWIGEALRLRHGG